MPIDEKREKAIRGRIAKARKSMLSINGVLSAPSSKKLQANLALDCEALLEERRTPPTRPNRVIRELDKENADLRALLREAKMFVASITTNYELRKRIDAALKEKPDANT